MKINRKKDFQNLPAFNGPEATIKAFLRACKVCESHMHRDEVRVRHALRFIFQKAHKDGELRKPRVIAREVRRRLDARTRTDKFLDFINWRLR
jgi:hypothetical protein